jgi:hypothetical protein
MLIWVQHAKRMAGKTSDLLVNGDSKIFGVASYDASAAAALQASDNTAPWFTSGMPNVFPNWI